MKGIVVFYINFHPEYNQEIQSSIDVVLKANKEIMDRINKDSDYQVMIVPTTKEACRVEKIDFDKPFPRYIARTHLDVVDEEKKKADRDATKERERLEKEKEKLKKEQEDK